MDNEAGTGMETVGGMKTGTRTGTNRQTESWKLNKHDFSLSLSFSCFFLLLLLLLLLLWPQSALESQLGAAFRHPLGHMVAASNWTMGQQLFPFCPVLFGFPMTNNGCECGLTLWWATALCAARQSVPLSQFLPQIKQTAVNCKIYWLSHPNAADI